MKTYSQYNQDRMVLRLIGNSGLFVDVGAFDGIKYSNTYALERAGWMGTCLEPEPAAYSALVKNRCCYTFNCCISDRYGMTDILIVDDLPMSGFIPNEKHAAWVRSAAPGTGYHSVQVRRVRLSVFIYPATDYISIDTEGHELEVLAGMDWTVPVKLWTIENAYHGKAIRRVMRAHGYRLLTLRGVDEVYTGRGIRFSPWLAWYWLEGIVKLSIQSLTWWKKSIWPWPWWSGWWR